MESRIRYKWKTCCKGTMKASSSVLALMAFLLFASVASAHEVFPVKYEKVQFSWKSKTLFEGIIKVYICRTALMKTSMMS